MCSCAGPPDAARAPCSTSSRASSRPRPERSRCRASTSPPSRPQTAMRSEAGMSAWCSRPSTFCKGSARSRTCSWALSSAACPRRDARTRRARRFPRLGSRSAMRASTRCPWGSSSVWQSRARWRAARTCACRRAHREPRSRQLARGHLDDPRCGAPSRCVAAVHKPRPDPCPPLRPRARHGLERHASG